MDLERRGVPLRCPQLPMSPPRLHRGSLWPRKQPTHPSPLQVRHATPRPTPVPCEYAALLIHCVLMCHVSCRPSHGPRWSVKMCWLAARSVQPHLTWHPGNLPQSSCTLPGRASRMECGFLAPWDALVVCSHPGGWHHAPHATDQEADIRRRRPAHRCTPKGAHRRRACGANLCAQAIPGPAPGACEACDTTPHPVCVKPGAGVCPAHGADRRAAASTNERCART